MMPVRVLDLPSGICKVVGGSFQLVPEGEFFTGQWTPTIGASGARNMRWMADIELAPLIPGDNGDLRRLLAVRLAIVARSDKREPPGAAGCDTSAAPEWLAGADTDGQLTPTTIDVSSVPDWRCYRYRVLQSVVPLRNLIWSQP